MPAVKQIIPAPIGGWNDRDNPVVMESTFAVAFENAISTAGHVEMRKGYRQIVDTTGVNPEGRPISTVANYVHGDDFQLLFCCQNTGGLTSTFYRVGVDAQGDVICIPLANPMYAPDKTKPDEKIEYNIVGDMWGVYQFRSFLFLWSLNGKDKALYYDGTLLQVLDLYPRGQSVGEIDTKNAQNFCAYHKRIFFSERNTPYVWFVYGVEERDGECDYFDVSVSLKKGGSINGICEWSRAGNDDSQVLLCVASSEGEILTYSGNSPADEDWTCTNMVQAPNVLLYRNNTIYKNDVMMLTQSGVYPLTSIVGAAVVDKEQALSDIIRGACSRWISYTDLDFWQILYLPSLNWIVINIPLGRGDFDQYICNMENMTWAKFTGVPAVHFCNVGDSVVFGGKNGNLYEFMAGATDGDYTSIRFYVQTAYINFEQPNKKRFKHVELKLMSAYRRNIRLISFVDGQEQAITISAINGQNASHNIGQWGDRTLAPDTGGSKWNTDYWGQPRGIMEQQWQTVPFGLNGRSGEYLSIGVAIDGYEKKENVFGWFDGTVRVEIGSH